MSIPVSRPTVRVAARRRCAFLWLPLIVVGVLVSLAGGPMITVFNSLDGLGLALMVAGLVRLVREVEK